MEPKKKPSLKLGKINHYSREEKIEQWGEGEWVDEPDQDIFYFKGFLCIVRRLGSHWLPIIECNGAFGGYVVLPPNHPLNDCTDDVFDERLLTCESVHGGITCCGNMSHIDENFTDEIGVGFDCAHAWDKVPLLEKLFKERRDRTFFDKIHKEHPVHADLIKNMFYTQYRNFDFAVHECKHLASWVRSYPILARNRKK